MSSINVKSHNHANRICNILLICIFVLHQQSFISAFILPSSKRLALVHQENVNIIRHRMYFDFNDEPIMIPQEKYDQVLDWAFEDSNKPPLTIKKSDIGHGNGLYATKSFDLNNVVFTIAQNKCLSLQDAKSHPTLGKTLSIMEEDLGEEFGPVAVLSSFLAGEFLREQCAEWEEDPSLSGLYGPYLATLPTGRAVSQQDHVLWWNEKEVDDLFQDGAAHEKATALREWVTEEGSIIEGMLVTDLVKQNMGLSISQGKPSTIMI